MRDEVEREIKRRDAEDDAARNALRPARAPRTKRLRVERHDFAGKAARFFRCDSESPDGAIHFAARGSDGFARFNRNRAGELVASRFDTVGDTSQTIGDFITRRRVAFGGGTDGERN